jgi:hypothetical protein
MNKIKHLRFHALLVLHQPCRRYYHYYHDEKILITGGNQWAQKSPGG